MPHPTKVQILELPTVLKEQIVHYLDLYLEGKRWRT
jgi:hypothetical protein